MQRADLVSLYVLFSWVVAATVFEFPAAYARGGAAAPHADAEIEREVKVQDRLIRSALSEKRGFGGIVRRYKQQALKANSPLARFLVGRAHEVNREYDEGLAAMQTATQLWPDFHQAHYRMAVMYAQKKDSARMEQHIDRALRLRPSNPDYVQSKARALFARKDYKGAITFAKRLREVPGRSERHGDAALSLMANAYVWLGDPASAKRLVEAQIRRHPKLLRLRRQWVDCSLKLEQWDAAIGELKNILSVTPDDMRMRRKLAEAHVRNGEVAAALKVLRSMVRDEPGSLPVRAMLVKALLIDKDYDTAAKETHKALARLPRSRTDKTAVSYRAWGHRTLAECRLFGAKARLARSPDDDAAAAWVTAEIEEAKRHLEEAARSEPLSVKALDRFDLGLAMLGRHKERLPYLRRRHVLLKERPKEAARVAKIIELIEAGGDGIVRPKPEKPSADVLAALIARCVDEDVAVRQKALQEYYELDLTFVDPTIYQRMFPSIEPDPICRLAVIYILGRFRAGRADPGVMRTAARYAGLALEDSVGEVRNAGATALGSIRAPAGLLYLFAHIKAMSLDPPTSSFTDEEMREIFESVARSSLEREYNAARLALVKLTGRNDIANGEKARLPLSGAEANRNAWLAWMDSKAGVKLRLEALEDLGRISDVGPRWQLRYVLTDVIQASPAVPAAIALKSYEVLRDRVLAVPAELREKDPWWRTFPVHTDAKLNAAGLVEVRRSMLAWWNEIQRKGTSEARSDGKK